MVSVAALPFKSISPEKNWAIRARNPDIFGGIVMQPDIGQRHVADDLGKAAEWRLRAGALAALCLV